MLKCLINWKNMLQVFLLSINCISVCKEYTVHRFMPNYDFDIFLLHALKIHWIETSQLICLTRHTCSSEFEYAKFLRKNRYMYTYIWPGRRRVSPKITLIDLTFWMNELTTENETASSLRRKGMQLCTTIVENGTISKNVEAPLFLLGYVSQRIDI